MKNLPTKELDKKLENVSCKEISNYLRTNKDFLINTDKAFTNYFHDILVQKRLKIVELIDKLETQVPNEELPSRKYLEKILSQEKHSDNRDLIIAFCIVGKFSREETNTALKLYKERHLYSKDSRDVVLILALNNRVCRVDEINKLLEANNEKKLLLKKQKK